MLWCYDCIVLCCVVLYRIVSYCIVLFRTVLYCIALHCIVLYCTVQYCIVLYGILLYRNVLLSRAWCWFLFYRPRSYFFCCYLDFTNLIFQISLCIALPGSSKSSQLPTTKSTDIRGKNKFKSYSFEGKCRSCICVLIAKFVIVFSVPLAIQIKNRRAIKGYHYNL